MHPLAPLLIALTTGLQCLGVPADGSVQDPPTSTPPSEPRVDGETPGTDRIQVRLAPEIIEALRESPPTVTPVRPRLLVLFCETDGPVGGRDPIEAPFFRRPQPIRSIPVDLGELTRDSSFALGDDAGEVSAIPSHLRDLQGTFALRAVLDLGKARGHDEPGNPISGIVEAAFSPERTDEVTLEIRSRIEAEPLPAVPDLEWVEIESPMLSKALDRPVRHRAGVVLPPGYRDVDHPRRFWPTLFVIPGFGGDHRDALQWSRLHGPSNRGALAPPAVIVVLDPNDPLGHHGFVDGDNTGPRGRALVEEFIPWLEKRFRLVSDPRDRILLGHSSGAWASLWLQMEHPDVFGACFASAPDPVDFSAFQLVDLTREDELWVDEDDLDFPSYREPLGPELDRILMTIRDEMAMERAIAPDLTSGEQWSAWNAMFSRRDPATGRPAAAFDLETGRIDRGVIDHDWSRFDLVARLRRDPARLAPLFRERVRLVCGTRDSFYLENAVRRLAETLDEVDPRGSDDPTPSGYVELVDGATHDSIVGHAMSRWLTDLKTLCERNVD